MGNIESVNIAHVRTGPWTGQVGRTGIDKRPVDGPVRCGPTGVHGDSVLDTEHHGAWFQAACAFGLDDLRHWAAELGKELVPGNAGENLTLSGLDCNHAVIGERWRIGSAVFRVTGPRNPCRVFAGFWDVGDLVKRFTAFGRPGAYLAVEEAGEVRAGDAVEVLSRPAHGVTVAEVFAFRVRGRRELGGHVARALGDLPRRWADKIAALLPEKPVPESAS